MLRYRISPHPTGGGAGFRVAAALRGRRGAALRLSRPSYEYIASVLPTIDRRAAEGRTVVAHLGNGASMCALSGGRSVATTMSFTALDGLVMGTRCGAIDAGVLLYLIDRHGMDPRSLEELLYEESGLLGVSGISSDMRTLLASSDRRAAEALGPVRLPHHTGARLACGCSRRARRIGVHRRHWRKRGFHSRPHLSGCELART